MIRTAVLLSMLLTGPVLAQDLTLPTSARQISDRTSPLDSYDLPTGPYENGAVPSDTIEGRVERFTWRLQAGSSTTLQLLSPLRDQIEAQGYKILFECEAQACGGFDFRFWTEVVPTPDMYVAIQDYRFLSATKGSVALSLLVSRNPPDGYVQLIRVTPQDAPDPDPVLVEQAVEGSGGLLEALTSAGHVILDDLHFPTGEVALGEGPFASLTLVAGYLSDNPDTRLALVGHTDDTGALSANISVSKSRAEAVRTRLIEAHGVAPERIEAQGVGYLAPITSNATPEGRDLNRRVEAVLLVN
ncbi:MULTISPECIES: OmpA family protein [unclassified Ruegeria]|uniref:OmpA family protein n=1 Tax=unclassified Ruegeria TaxID=2625375 RepID=UPI001489109D|nr:MULTISPECIES: OmpA family protein [unclassified Ruegeria]NOD76296.1 OmpA family protein [Ruegeria sp. HKCCD4332]NOD90251.1 OmpA family protein [Ruegeria sp. HKCCD4318]NOE15324.1 OmpA family protein [Ruegeria sp. HKCCD4318-2]NOG10466.1 OmpA family protein [Ruegeria sp. HKCCD4315]